MMVSERTCVCDNVDNDGGGVAFCFFAILIGMIKFFMMVTEMVR